MQPSDFAEITALLAYASAAALILFGLPENRSAQLKTGVVLAIVGVVLHGLSFWLEFNRIGGLGLDFFTSLALVSLIMAVLVLIGMIRFALLEVLPLAMSGAALMTALKMVFAPDPGVLESGSAMLDLHIISSLLAYSLLSIAAITAVFISVLHTLLHRRTGVGIIQALPPLVVMESLLFRMIAAGWVLLSLSLASGIFFIDDLFAQHLAHKTILSILSWLVFGLLLAGRWRYGWRGMRVVRLCLVGMAILVLAYFGSKAVLELMLDRSWQR